jgi:hypothetical protein
MNRSYKEWPFIFNSVGMKDELVQCTVFHPLQNWKDFEHVFACQEFKGEAKGAAPVLLYPIIFMTGSLP